jgi:hypothetical protein
MQELMLLQRKQLSFMNEIGLGNWPHECDEIDW